MNTVIVNPNNLDLHIENVVEIWRCAAVIKGGRRFSFAALVVVGDGNGYVGVGYGKAREVPAAIEKATKDARKNCLKVVTDGDTIPHEVKGRFGSSRVVLVPASPGTGIIAGPAVRAVMQAAGIHDVLTKSYGGSNNARNLVKAALNGLLILRSPGMIQSLRGVELKYLKLAGQEAAEKARQKRRSDAAPTPTPAGDGTPAEAVSLGGEAAPAAPAGPDTAKGGAVSVDGLNK